MWARGTVAAAVVLVTVAVLPAANEPYAVPKVTALGVTALAVFGIWLWQVTSTGVIELPRHVVPVLAPGLAVLLGLSAVLHDHRLSSVFGSYGRSDGFLAYAAAALLLLGVIWSQRPDTLRTLAWVIVGSAVPVVAYGLVQRLGWDPLGLSGPVETVVSTLGQQDFVGGWSGIVLPFAAWGALQERTGTGWRWTCGVLVVAIVGLGLVSRSFQTFPAMAAGGLLVAAVVAARRAGRIGVVRGLAAVAVAVVLVGLVGHSRIEREIRSGLDERVLMWQAAGSMIADSPLFGQGPAGYAAKFTAYRPLEHAKRFGLFQIVDAPHDVPLAMAVAGGAVVALTYAAFVGATGWALVRGLRRLEGDELILLAAFGGAWVAYQVQSLVSIDVPTTITLHFLLAGAIVVLGGDLRWREQRFAALTPRRAGRSTVTATTAKTVRVFAGILLLLLAWQVVRPLRADLAYADGLQDEASGPPEAAVASLKSATAVASWNGTYLAQLASVLAKTGDQDGALVVGEEAAHRAPSSASYALSAAQLAHRLGKDAVAKEYFDLAVANAPGVADAVEARAQFLVAEGKYEVAERDARQAVQLAPADFKAYLVLAQAFTGQQRVSDAERAYRRVLALNPSSSAAYEQLASLYEAAGRADDALAVWRELYRIDPTDVRAREKVGPR
jgi:Tfp pilus assembly protein PilF